MTAKNDTQSDQRPALGHNVSFWVGKGFTDTCPPGRILTASGPSIYTRLQGRPREPSPGHLSSVLRDSLS